MKMSVQHIVESEPSKWADRGFVPYIFTTYLWFPFQVLSIFSDTPFLEITIMRYSWFLYDTISVHQYNAPL